MKRLFTMPIQVTAITFDQRGNSFPSRIDYNGKNIYPVKFSEKLVSFKIDSSYFWLVRRNNHWNLTTDPPL